MSSLAALVAAEADHAEWLSWQDGSNPCWWSFTDAEGLVWTETAEPLLLDCDTAWDYLPIGHCRFWCQVWCETKFDGLQCLQEEVMRK
jgi:hypothetical protein